MTTFEKPLPLRLFAGTELPAEAEIVEIPQVLLGTGSGIEPWLVPKGLVPWVQRRVLPRSGNRPDAALLHTLTGPSTYENPIFSPEGAVAPPAEAHEEERELTLV